MKEISPEVWRAHQEMCDDMDLQIYIENIKNEEYYHLDGLNVDQDIEIKHGCYP